MKKVLFSALVITLCFFLTGCDNSKIAEDDNLLRGFKNPPAEARPFVRWWWNGNHLTEKEISRQLDVLASAGFGGVEINPIEMPEEAVNIGTKPVEWLSRDWNQLLLFATKEAKKHGMIADLIVGSGWPFGGEFLKDNETIQRVIINKIPCSGGEKINQSTESLYRKALAAMERKETEEAKSYNLLFIRLVPKDIKGTSEIVDLTGKVNDNQFVYDVPEGNFDLVYGMLQRSHRDVMHGALGAAGPVMDHYDRNITIAYLSRLKKISEDTGVPLSELIRALFCDSIELAGANWTKGLEEIFFQTYNYRLEPYFPFVFYDSQPGYKKEKYDLAFADQLRRVRYDYNKLLVDVFLKNFTHVFQDFCTENNLKCRYQAYGTPFLMGMMEGNMIADIPESNNWIYSTKMDAERWTWNQGHGYMIWNLYAASGGHLTGKKIISCEAMTNTKGVFKTSLDEIKQHDDMNFISGMNHAILHGYNYSPQEAGFPGWIRYGSYFSEQNTWWPYLKKWTDYNARLSYVFQQAKPVKEIAILAPEGDIWSDNGLSRMPFHMQPWYCYRLWESLSQAGSSCDYINERIIRDGSVQNGILQYGPMSYKAIFLSSVWSLNPETALSLKNYVSKGGKIVLIDKIPERSLSLKDGSANDSIVSSIFDGIRTNFPDRFFTLNSPPSESELLSWTNDLLKKIDLAKDVDIENPDKSVYQIRKKFNDKEIYFFVNTNRAKTISLKASFPTGDKIPWEWNPEEGRRSIYLYEGKPDRLTIELQPLQSLLLIFEPDLTGEPEKRVTPMTGDVILTVNGPWKSGFKHINGQTFERSFEQLAEFGTSDDQQLNTFAGIVTYLTEFNSDGAGSWLRLGKVNKGVTEVYLNGKSIGSNWYGNPVFPVAGIIKNGNNILEIKYTTVLSNYAMSLKGNLTAERWTAGFERIPIGLEGAVQIFE